MSAGDQHHTPSNSFSNGQDNGMQHVDYSPHPTENWQPNYFMCPVQTCYTVNTSKMTGNNWLDDAPMPEYFTFPSTSTDENDDPNNTSAFNHLNSDSQLVPSQIISPQESEFSGIPPIEPEIATAENGNLDEVSIKKESKESPKEKQVVEVRPTIDETLLPEVQEPSEVRGWCTVHYYELSVRYGDDFVARRPTFTIDGVSKTSNETRMAIDSFPPSKVQKCGLIRNQIGDGIRIHCENGVVWLTLLTDALVFIKCPFRNLIMNEPIDTVLRIQNDREGKDENGKWIIDLEKTVKLFDKQRFEYEQLAAMRLDPKEAGSLLQSFCVTRVSFCKGFGEHYRRRQIHEVNSWIEIILHEPIEVYDRFIRSSSEKSDIGSRS